MAADREQPDQLSENQLQQLLQAGLGAPQPSAEFSARLFDRLDREFCQRADSTENTSTEKSRTPVEFTTVDPAAMNNRAAADGQRSPAEGVLPFNALATPRAKSRRTRLRVIGAIGAAAALLIALNLWSSSTAYGWAAMINALRQTTWVQATAADGRADGWMSSDRGVVAVKADDQVAFRDSHRQTLSEFHAGDGVVYLQPLAARGTWNLERRLLALLMLHQRGLAAKLDDLPQEVKVVDESWRPLENDQVELNVTLSAANHVVRLVMSLNAETHLPVSCRVLGDAAGAANQFEFTYPADGPTSIYSLGVPRDTEVVAGVARATVDASRSEPLRTASRSRLQQETDDSPGPQPVEVVVADQIVQPERTEPKPEPTSEPQVASAERRPVQDLPTAAPLPEPLAPDELVAKIDSQLSAYWQDQAIRPVEPASDAEFLRRVYLDLTGRIPMVSEVYSFLQDQSDSRRENLVDELLTSRDHATHLATVWRTMLLPDGVDVRTYGGTRKFDQWLADRFGANLPYDRLVGELLSAEGRVAESGPLLFYAALKLNPEEIAAKTSRVFLGMRMECAQCHDDKFDESISQHDFWGFAAYFAQISRPKGKMEMTSAVLRVRDNTHGEVMIPDSDEIVPPRLPQLGFAMPDDSADDASRRRQLVDWLTSAHNTRFARATVNRVWEHLFGRGLVMPVDDMRADNEPVCPEVLETLSRDFAASGYDLRRLLRALVLSDAYQLSSRAPTDDPSQSLAFARMNIKSFTADQLYDCIAVATQNETMLASGATEDALARFDNSSRQAFIEQFRAPPGERTDYHAGIPQALSLMHGGLVHGATDLASSGLLNAPFFLGDEQRVETLMLATLSRLPQPEEREQLLAHLAAAPDDDARQDALGDVLWALLNSAEFTFIH